MREWTREERYRMLKDPQELWPLYQKIHASDFRESYHIQPVTGLLNDPNGFVWHAGKWHLFYQWCPWGAVHGLKYWYHIVSKDLITWKNLGVCLIPGDYYDNKGAYSGSAMPIGNEIYLYYTGNRRNENWVREPYTCLAKVGDDGWMQKYPLPLFGANPDYTEHQRDPKIVVDRARKCCFLILGAQTKDRRGRALVYRSENLLHGWHFAGELKVPGYENFGDMWECPTIEHIGGKEVLMFCPQHIHMEGRGEGVNHNGYIIGNMDWDSLTFTPDGQFHRLDFGFDSYAAACANNTDDPDKAVLIAWMGMPDASYPTDEEDWQGCLTLPRELTVRGRRLIQRPLPLLRELRDDEVRMTGDELTATASLPRVCELEMYIRGGDTEVGLFTAPDGSGGLRIHYTENEKKITVDRAGMKKRFNQSFGETRMRILDGSLAHLRIFIDRSSCEIFVNDGDAVFTTRVFPTEGENRFFVRGDAFVRMWNLKPAVRDDFII